MKYNLLVTLGLSGCDKLTVAALRTVANCPVAPENIETVTIAVWWQPWNTPQCAVTSFADQPVTTPAPPTTVPPTTVALETVSQEAVTQQPTTQTTTTRQ